MQLLGPETTADRELREWFEGQQRGNIERLEQGAQTIIQLVSGLYGVLFAVLALSDQPAYLKTPIVQWAGTIGVCAFFAALLAAMLAALPRRFVYETDNLTEMKQVYNRLQGRKATLLRTAQVIFLLGTACLVTVILAILWQQ
jgi:Trk-type K+ transport system membrane component